VGDYSKFGPRLLSAFVTASYDIMTDWYSQFGPPEKDQVTRRVLGKRATNSYNICYDQVIRLKSGSPSGAINTVVVNSICNLMYIRCAWLGIMKIKSPATSSLQHFRENVRFYCYGDDVIFSVKPEVIELFNNQTISDYFALYDVKYTDVTKGSEMRKWCSIEEASFLKCGFKRFLETSVPGGAWVCLPNIGDIKDTTNWVRKPKGTKSGSNIKEILLDGAASNCGDALRKIWFHGRKPFEELQNKIRQWWKCNYPEVEIPILDYEGLMREYGYPPGRRSFAHSLAFSCYSEEYVQDEGHGGELNQPPRNELMHMSKRRLGSSPINTS